MTTRTTNPELSTSPGCAAASHASIPPTTATGSRFASALRSVLALALLYAVQVAALYPPDGLKPDGAGGYMNPGDGMCVIGINMNGDMLVDWSITNARDCAAWTKSADGSVDLASMTTRDSCTKAGFVGPPVNDGYKHAWSTSICYDTANQKGISRVDLDNTDTMCSSKGGTVVTTGKCVAYGWQYRNRKADNTLPVTGTGIATTKSPQFSDGLGFCSTSMRMTSATYNSAATCPSAHNSPALSPAEWPACLSSPSGCQTQASYNEGLGWSFSGNQCLYQYGVKGIINAAATKADGSTYLAGSSQDLTQYTTMGDCLANGFLWDNWLNNDATVLESATDPGRYPGIPAGSLIRTLDAISHLEDGGGEFYTGAGAVCTKCHTDQSRSYMERNKPGFAKTRHRLAGEAVGESFQPFFMHDTSAWGLQGVQCAMCHSTAKPAQDDLIQVVPGGTPGAGIPKSASGHQNTEYGAHLIGICYTCHGTPAVPASVNPAAVIPVSSGEFELTDKGLEPLTNMFLNSPHARYTGSSAKIDTGNKAFYNSPFVGYVCRSGATPFRSAVPPGDSQANCQAAGHTWYVTPAPTGNFCYYNQSSCAALSTGEWTATFNPAAYPFAVATGGPGALCTGVGIGSILTTVYRNGVAEKIPNLNSTVNEACTNPGDGSASSGADGFWVKEGTTAPGLHIDTAQGNCMTCHDIHWALAEEGVGEAEPLRKECITCHAKDLTKLRHGRGEGEGEGEGGGVPVFTDPKTACVFCHMPNEWTRARQRMHLFRISASSSYSTFPSAFLTDTQANTAPDTVPDGTYTYANAAWVDVDRACGQCHGGGSRRTLSTGSITAGTNTVTVAGTGFFGSGFLSGQRVEIVGAGQSGADLRTYIRSISGRVLTLVHNAATSVQGARVEQNPTKNNAPWLSKSFLASRAAGIHGDKPVVFFTHTTSSGQRTVNVDASRTTCSSGCDVYSWNWGDGSPKGSGVTASHTYAAKGTYQVTLTVVDTGVNDASLTHSVTVGSTGRR